MESECRAAGAPTDHVPVAASSAAWGNDAGAYCPGEPAAGRLAAGGAAGCAERGWRGLAALLVVLPQPAAAGQPDHALELVLTPARAPPQAHAAEPVQAHSLHHARVASYGRGCAPGPRAARGLHGLAPGHRGGLCGGVRGRGVRPAQDAVQQPRAAAGLLALAQGQPAAAREPDHAPGAAPDAAGVPVARERHHRCL
eukprot:scaffold7734_cov592-Prasinococcus_capsulatus_cf.AAC.1